MYTLRQTVVTGGRAVDDVATPFGIRTIHFDKDSGFALNGRRLKLNGVNRITTAARSARRSPNACGRDGSRS